MSDPGIPNLKFQPKVQVWQTPALKSLLNRWARQRAQRCAQRLPLKDGAPPPTVSPRGLAKAMPGKRLWRFARRVARSARKKKHCALPCCGRQARALRCCGKALCTHCCAHTLRASLDRRLVSRCPFCRKAARPRAAALRRMMAAACPSHALVVETEGGPPAPCPTAAGARQRGAPARRIAAGPGSAASGTAPRSMGGGRLRSAGLPLSPRPARARGTRRPSCVSVRLLWASRPSCRRGSG